MFRVARWGFLPLALLVSLPALSESAPADASVDPPATAEPTADAPTPAASGTTPTDPIEDRVDAILAGMTREQKVGQLLFVGFGGKDVEKGGAIEQLVKGKQVGGVALFSRNVKSIPQIGRFTRQISALLPDIPPFIAVDQEGGNVVRLKHPATVLPSNMALGAARDPDLTRRAAASLARDMWLLGFNMNLAPVLDVNSNPKNPVIDYRSFGEDPTAVGTQGAAYIAGLQGGGVAAVAKHFPGHGDTSADSHYGKASIPHGLERLLQVELAPFRAASDAGVDAIMTAHIALPAIEGEPDVPATVSKKVLTGILREELGFQGIIITDGMEMKGIVDAYGSGPAAVKAILAGADMVLILWTKEKKEEVHQALLAATEAGTISAQRLDTSVRRILRVKVKRGIFDNPPPPLARALRTLGDGATGRAIAEEIAERSLTLVRGKPGLTPIDRDRYKRIVVLSADAPFAQEMRRQFGKRTKIIRTPAVPKNGRDKKDLARAIALGKKSDLMVVGVLNRYQTSMVKELSRQLEIPVIVVAMGSPYLLTGFPEVDAYLAAYSYRESATRNAALFLAGKKPAPGRLPVSLPGLYPIGHTATKTQLDAFGGAGSTD